MVTRLKIPSKIEQRKLVWDNTYIMMPNPLLPVKPTNYIETADNDDGDEEDLDDEDNARALDLLTSVPSDLPPLASTDGTVVDVSAVAQSLLTLSTAPATQVPNIQGNVQAL